MSRIDNWVPFVFDGYVYLEGDISGHPTHNGHTHTGAIVATGVNVAYSENTTWELGEGDMELLEKMIAQVNQAQTAIRD